MARPIQRLMPTPRESRQSIELVHIPAPGQLARVCRGLNRAVVADAPVLKRFVSSSAVLLSEERPKECAIDLAQALVGICREALP